jgi:hypothetical protein
MMDLNTCNGANLVLYGHSSNLRLGRRDGPIEIECKWSARTSMPPTLQAFRRQYPNEKNFVRGWMPSLRPNIITEGAGHIHRALCEGWESNGLHGASARSDPPYKKRKDEALSAWRGRNRPSVGPPDYLKASKRWKSGHACAMIATAPPRWPARSIVERPPPSQGTTGTALLLRSR